MQDFLFPGTRQGHVTPAALERRFQEYVKAVGFSKRITPHALRHSVAVHYLLRGAPISFVQQLLGHESLETTGVHTRLTDAMTKEVALRTKRAIDGESQTLERANKPLKEARSEYMAEGLEWEVLLEVVQDGPLKD